MNKKSVLQISGFVLAVLLGWVGYLAWCASRNLVTLNVSDADVREVIRKIERQTRETLLMDENIQGKVTFRVKRVPLETVLGIMDDQVSIRWSVVYPLYSTSHSLDMARKSLRGEVNPATSGWTNLQERGGWGGFGGFGGGGRRGGFDRGGGGAGGGGPFGGGPGDPLQTQNQFVSLDISGKDLQFTTLAMSRYAQTRIVPEDGATATISVKFNQTKVDSAVAKIAKQARRKWAKLYVLRGERDRDRRGPPGQLASLGTNSEPRRFEDGDRRREWTDITPEQRDERRKQRETLEEELKATLPPEQRTKLEQAQQEREQTFQQMQNLTPEQRRERFSQMAGAGRDQRAISRIKNTTPEQRVERNRRFEQMRLWRQQNGGGGGRGPGRGGR